MAARIVQYRVADRSALNVLLLDSRKNLAFSGRYY